MKTQVDTATKFNLAKWVVVALLIAVGVVANYYFSAQPLAIRLSGWIVLLLIASLIALNTKQGHRFAGFARESRIELRKVVWPNRQETVQTTMVVILMVIITAVILWCIDSIFLWLISWLTANRG